MAERQTRAVRDWLTPIAWGYAALVVAWLALRALAGDGPWWLAVLNTDALALFLPLAALLPVAIWRHRPRAILGLAVPIAGFVWLFGDLLLPPVPPPALTGPALTVMTFNVLWSNTDYDRLLTTIRTADADLVALQELRPGHRLAIDTDLAADYPHRTVHPADQSVGLLSRYPIEAAMPLPDPPFERALLVRVRAGGRPLTVVVAHLVPTNMLDRGLAGLPATVTERYARRADQADALLATARAAGSPTVVLCDCNLTDTSAAYARLQSGLTDSFSAAGWGLRRTMLSTGLVMPAQRLDYIWHSAELRAVDAWVGQDGGSDHLPAVARLTWREPARAGRGAGTAPHRDCAREDRCGCV